MRFLAMSLLLSIFAFSAQARSIGGYSSAFGWPASPYGLATGLTFNGAGFATNDPESFRNEDPSYAPLKAKYDELSLRIRELSDKRQEMRAARQDPTAIEDQRRKLRDERKATRDKLKALSRSGDLERKWIRLSKKQQEEKDFPVKCGRNQYMGYLPAYASPSTAVGCFDANNRLRSVSQVINDEEVSKTKFKRNRKGEITRTTTKDQDDRMTYQALHKRGNSIEKLFTPEGKQVSECKYYGTDSSLPPGMLGRAFGIGAPAGAPFGGGIPTGSPYGGVNRPGLSGEGSIRRSGSGSR